MARAVISPKFQVVIPKEIRERLDLRPGQVVSFIARNGMVTLVPQSPIADLRPPTAALVRTWRSPSSIWNEGLPGSKP